MKLIKLAIILWGVSAFLGILIAFPANVFFLVLAFCGYLFYVITFGSADYWRRYYDHVYGDATDE